MNTKREERERKKKTMIKNVCVCVIYIQHFISETIQQVSFATFTKKKYFGIKHEYVLFFKAANKIFTNEDTRTRRLTIM